jgi:monothiol glutaredoxin|tara:strand:- start:53 stop:403 length:351 start_codon:yes stop_codon:yes gene_type:complete
MGKNKNIGVIMDLKEQIVQEIDNNSIILYMKGTKEMPMCGFSNSVVQILNHYGVEYKDVNILADPMIRVKLSEHSGWPTIPQLFVKGKLIGGADITMELHNNGELLDMLDVSKDDE